RAPCKIPGMQRSTGRILVSHAGALPRPDDLRDLLVAKESGKPYDEAVYQRRVREVIADVVRKQLATGIDVVNDGEESKRSFSSYARTRIKGFEERTVDISNEPPTIYMRDYADFPGFFGGGSTAFAGQSGLARSFTTTAARVFCTAPLEYVGHAAIQEDIDNLKHALSEPGLARPFSGGMGVSPISNTQAFLPAVAPGTVEHWMTNEYYKTDEEFVYAIAEAMRPEYQAIVDAGFVLQIDDPDLGDGWQMFPEMSVADYHKYAEMRIEALNHALRGIPEDRIRFHMCWGSHHGPHKHDLPLADFIDLIVKVPAECYSIEAANTRHEHEWRVWQDVKLPDGKSLMPGVTGHTSDMIEHPRLIADRLIRYANVVGRENVIAGTDCGLGPRVGHAEIVWSKFEAMAEGARIATRELWRR
ncbi:MAG TPA: cobalamin-independent methionine synthase II family protein, partial [Dehalococcoidia bacterium]|nr:cobalamin-independent methionine synthase II family protein [Dehalococcoidia bacterium]